MTLAVKLISGQLLCYEKTHIFLRKWWMTEWCDNYLLYLIFPCIFWHLAKSAAALPLVARFRITSPTILVLAAVIESFTATMLWCDGKRKRPNKTDTLVPVTHPTLLQTKKFFSLCNSKIWANFCCWFYLIFKDGGRTSELSSQSYPKCTKNLLYVTVTTY